MRLKGRLANKIISWLTIITLIIQVVLPGGLFNFDVPKADAAITVAVVSPNGGQDWDIGDSQKITWTTVGLPPWPDYFKLYYSENGGTDWTLIDGNVIYTGSPQSYDWTIPVISGPNENDAQVKVEAYYTATGLITDDASDANFNIDYGPIASAVLVAPADAGPGKEFTLTVTAKDQYANTITNFNQTVNIIATPGPITPTTIGDGTYGSWSNGTASYGNYKIELKGTHTITAYYYPETQITTNSSAQASSAIYNNRIVWQDARNGNNDIYMYDISTSTESQITTNSSNQNQPAIYNNRIVWYDDRNVNWDIYMYDISTSTESQITTNSASQYYPAIYNNRIVWQDARNGNNDIYMYDISTSTESQITTNSSEQYYPAIYNNRIVWTDDRNGNYDIYMYDISTSTESQITTNSSNQIYPAIYGDYIVWYDNRNGDYDIYMYTISTGTETRITTGSSDQANPAIYGDYIVWHDNRNGDYDIYMYTISTGTETRITTNSSEQTYPDIYNNRIVWQDNRNGNYDIYMAKIIDDTADIEIKSGGGRTDPPDTTPPISKVVGIVDSGVLIKPMPGNLLVSEFTIAAEASDDRSGINSVDLYWNKTGIPPYQNYGHGSQITIGTNTYWKWDFVASTNGVYYFYSLAVDGTGANFEEPPKSFWTPTAQYDAGTMVNARTPLLLATNPIDKQTDVGINTTVRLVFDYDMDTASVAQAFSVKNTLTGIGNFRWIATWTNNNRTVVFSPVTGQTLAYDTDYTAFVDPDIAKNKDGERLSRMSIVPNPWTFRTAKQTATNLSTSTKIADKNFCPAGDTITYTIVLVNSGTATANVTFTDAIPVNTVYNNYISNAIYDLVNNRITWTGPLRANGTRTIRFRVLVNQPLPNGTRITNEAKISDGINPTISKYAITIIDSPLGNITSTTPMHNTRDIAISTTIKVVFSLAMNKPSVGQAFKVTETVSGNVVPGWTAIWSNLDRTATFSLPIGQTLRYLTGYTVLVDQSIAITARGAPLQTPTTAPNPWQFTTAAQKVPNITLSTKISNADTAQPGDPLTYTITLRNIGTATANVTFVDYIPVNTVYDRYVRNATWDAINNRITWTRTLAVNATWIITFRVRINSPLPNGTMITNTAEINDGFNPTIYRYAQTLVQSPLAQILLTAPRNGEVNVAIRPTIQITFSQTMDRVSTQNAFSVTKVSGNPGGPTTWNPIWSINDTVVRFTLSLGQQLDYDSIYSAFVDPTIAKTRKGAPLDTVHPVSNPWTFTTAYPNMFDSTKPVDKPTALPGDLLTYNITLRNSGTAPANVVFRDSRPVNTTYVSFTGRGVIWDPVNQRITWSGPLAVNATKLIIFRVRIISPLPNGTIITNAAEISDGFNPMVIKYAETLVQSPLAKIVATSPMNGETNVAIRPTMRVTFDRPMDRTLVWNAFNFSKVGGTPPPISYRWTPAWSNGDRVVTFTLAVTIPPQSLEYSSTYQVWIDPAIARTKLGAPIEEGGPVANPWTFNTALLNIPDLSSSTKGVNLPITNPGKPLLYTIILRNTSYFAATVIVEDYIPANTAYLFGSATGGLSYDMILKRMRWTGTVPARSTRTMTFRVTVNNILPNGTVITNEVKINDGKNPIFSKFAETYIQSQTNWTNSSKTAANDNSERTAGTARPGDTLTQTIYVENSGNMDALGTLITDALPNNTTYVEGTASGGLVYNNVNKSFSWLGDVPALISKIFSFKVIVDDNQSAFQPPEDKVINEAVITDLSNSFAVKSSITIITNGGGGGTDNPPYLVEITPINGASSVKLFTPITFKFSEDIVVSSLRYSVKVGEQTVDTSQWSVDEKGSSFLITIHPNQPLSIEGKTGQTFTITVEEAVNNQGQQLGQDGPIPNNTASFTTVRPMLYFVNKQVLTFRAGTISEAIKVKLGDWINYDTSESESTAKIYADYAVEDLGGISIQLWGTSATGRFDISPAGNFEKNPIYIIMPQGSSEITFYYTDSQINWPTIYWMVAYAPYTSYLIHGDLRHVSTNSSGGGDNLQNRIEFITESQNIPVNCLSNPIEFEILSPDGAVILLEAGKIFLLNTTSATGTFYNSFELPLDDPVNYEGRNYYQLAIPKTNTTATFYYRDSTPGPYKITVKESGVTSADTSGGPAVDGTQLITIVPLKDQDWDEDVLIKNIIDDSGRKLSYIVVEPDDVVLLPSAKQTFRAKGYDIDGKLIESLEFGWYVISGGGIIRQPYIGSSRATFTAGRTAGIYYDTVLAAAMYNGDLQGGYATVRVADVVDYGGPGHLPSTGPNGIQMIFILLMLFSAVALAEVEHYERTHFGRIAKPKGIK